MSISKVRLPNNTEEDIKAKYLIQSTSSDAVSEEFVEKITTEDAIANIQKIYGNAIKFNQLLSLSSFLPGATGISVVRDGDTFTLSYTSDTPHLWMVQDVSVISGHVYIVSYYAKLNRSSVPSSTYTGGYFITPTQWYGNISATDLATITNTGAYYKVRITASGNKTRAFFGLYRRSGTDTFSSSDSLVIKYPMLIDLTQMYGAGNEPTLAQFEEAFNQPYYDYNPSGLLSVKATAVQSTDSSNNVIGNCDLNIPTLTGKLNGTGSSVVIFSEGMKKAGTAYDEIVGNKAIKRVGSVDMGTMSWAYNSSSARFVSNSLVNLIKEPIIGSAGNAISAVYASVSYSQLGQDKAFTVIFSGSSSHGSIWLVDSAYDNASTFASAVSGVMLYYELATPEEYILDNALQLQYPVVAGGTEIVLPTSGTAPMKMDVIYGNAADATSNLSSNFISVDSMKAFLNNLGTQMGGTWNMQYNNGKFEFTFSSS